MKDQHNQSLHRFTGIKHKSQSVITEATVSFNSNESFTGANLNELSSAVSNETQASGGYQERVAHKLAKYKSDKDSNNMETSADDSTPSQSEDEQENNVKPAAEDSQTGTLASIGRHLIDDEDDEENLVSNNRNQHKRNNVYADRLAQKMQFYNESDGKNASNASVNSAGRAVSSNVVNADVSQDNDHDESQPGAFAATGLPPGQRPAWTSHPKPTSIESNQQWDSEEDLEHFGNVESSKTVISDTVARVVDREELKKEFCKSLCKDAVRAEVVVIDETKDKYRKYAWITFAIAMLAVAISIIAWLFMKDDNSTDFSQVPSMSLSLSPSLSPTTSPLPTLQTITDRDELRCAVSGNYEIEHTICKAIAAAVLGNANKTKKVIVDASNPYVALSNMEADVATTFSKFAMDKDVYQKDTQVGFTFTCPWFYDGYAFGGEPEYVQCAANLDGFFGECNKLRICVHADEAYDAVREWFPASMIKMVPFESFYQSFKDGKCNVLSGLSIEISEAVVREKINSEDYYSIPSVWLSKVTTAAVTTEVDAEWSNFVKWVVQALFAAEARNITRENADSFTTTNVFGEQYQNMFRNAIKAVGNYGTILEEDPLTSLVPRPPIQEQNDGSTGLIYSFPFGEHSNIVGPEPAEGSVMKNILDRGFIRCGVIIEENTTDWRLLGKEYCRALSASLFHGNASKVEFINVNSTINGYISLDRAEIDLLSGARVTLEADSKEPTTGKGFTFSLPYYYEDPQGESLQEGEFISGDSIGLVTREDDYPWSNFVFWMVPATFYAEEKGITKNLADEMPSINLFGSSLEDMYRHAIGAVGNYNEMYQKKWGVDGLSIMTRLGRNQLNRNPYGPQVKPMFSVR